MSDDLNSAIVLVYCPCPSTAEAERLGSALIDNHLAGCINIMPGMVSIYRWEGKRERSEEAVLLAKTSVERTAEVRSFIEREHPYDVPAILVVPLAEVNRAYADWLLQEMTGG